MPVPKSERLLNLLIMLLVQRRPIGKERIREVLYAGSRLDAFEKMFERDKEELRGLGVPIEVAPVDPLFDDEQGYRIPAEEFSLPSIELSADEASVVALATKVWQDATIAQATTDAVRKLSAAGVGMDLGALELATPATTSEEPSFAACWQAVCDRQAIRFDYQRPGQEPTGRRVQPWGMVRSSGRWYLVGRDLDRDAERVFRLDRFRSPVRKSGHAHAYDVPPDTDLRAVIDRLAPRPSHPRAVLLARTGTGHALRRRAASVDVGVPGPDGRSGWDRLVIDRPGWSLVEEVLHHGPDVVLLEPAELREDLVGRLRALVA